MGMKERIEELERRRAEIERMGGPERVEKQHARAKMTARERIAELFDKGSFFEVGVHGTQMMSDEKPPADAVVVGYGQVDGRTVCCASYDFTVMGGSIGRTGEVKVARMRELALRERVPMVWFIDSAGARIRPPTSGAHQGDMISVFADSGYLFREQVHMSGVVPQVAAMVGPGAAGTAYIPGLADFVPMVKGTSSMALGGPPLVKAVVGEEITEEALGGSRVHNTESGNADLEVKSDADCIQAIKDYLAYFPSNCDEKPPVRPYSGDPLAPVEELASVLPEEARKVYDMHRIIELLVDDGVYFSMKPKWAKNLITCFGRIGGRPVGFVANNPRHYGGVLDVNSADKAARFVSLCDAFNIPLVFLQDVPGFMVGSKVEREGIIRHGAKMLFAVADATVPKLTVIVRKAYGAGYYVMCGRAYEPDQITAWPTGEISVMGAEGMVGIFAKKALDAAEDPIEMRKQMASMIQPYIDIYKVAGWGFVDDVIDPRMTRAVLYRGLIATQNKTVERPRRKHGVVPV
ncbi:MAG: acyl-CoA carboxylase subunit beta [Myxococcales bacterium]|nr:acyl-CoA carboxylase subunit beta [Myxococcales bacterium]